MRNHDTDLERHLRGQELELPEFHAHAPPDETTEASEAEPAIPGTWCDPPPPAMPPGPFSRLVGILAGQPGRWRLLNESEMAGFGGEMGLTRLLDDRPRGLRFHMYVEGEFPATRVRIKAEVDLNSATAPDWHDATTAPPGHHWDGASVYRLREDGTWWCAGQRAEEPRGRVFGPLPAAGGET